MLDEVLRPVKDRTLAPLTSSPLGRLHPVGWTLIGLGLTVGAALAAWLDQPLIAVVSWLAGRLADGLDGLIARSTGRASDFGGLLDVVADTIGYAAVPIGLAAAGGETGDWATVAVLIGTFYVNAVSWTYLSAILAKRGRDDEPRTTSVEFPRGLVEGTETIVLYTIALAVPTMATGLFQVMAVLVAVTTIERLAWARRRLR